MDFFLEAIKKRFVTGQDARLRVGRRPRLCRGLRERRVPGAGGRSDAGAGAAGAGPGGGGSTGARSAPRRRSAGSRRQQDPRPPKAAHSDSY